MADVTGIVAAAAVAVGGKPKKSASDILATARARLDLAVSALSESREDEIDDLKFYAGSPDNAWQWPADVLATRGAVQGQTINARPCLTINKLPQHVRQVTNDQRQNRPGAKVIPVDDKADTQVAEIFNGMIRHIEYISDADVAYDTACENQVSYGEGYLRLSIATKLRSTKTSRLVGCATASVCTWTRPSKTRRARMQSGASLLKT